MGFVRTALLAGAAAVWASGALAAGLTFSGQTGYTVLDPTAPGTTVGGNVRAGGINASSGVPFGLSPNIVVWCLDLATYTNTPNDYIATTNPFNPGGIDLSANSGIGTLTKKDTIQKLFDANYASLDLSSATNSNRDRDSAAFQVAMWELAYETSPTKDSQSGSGAFFTNSASVNTQANLYLTAALAYTGAKLFNMTFLQSQVPNPNPSNIKSSQDFVTVSPVPLPAAGFLLIGGLGVLAMVRRRRGAATA